MIQIYNRSSNHNEILCISYIVLQNLLLLRRRHLRPRVRLHRHQQERDSGVPRIPVSKEEDGESKIKPKNFQKLGFLAHNLF